MFSRTLKSNDRHNDASSCSALKGVEGKSTRSVPSTRSKGARSCLAPESVNDSTAVAIPPAPSVTNRRNFKIKKFATPTKDGKYYDRILYLGITMLFGLLIFSAFYFKVFDSESPRTLSGIKARTDGTHRRRLVFRDDPIRQQMERVLTLYKNKNPGTKTPKKRKTKLKSLKDGAELALHLLTTWFQADKKGMRVFELRVKNPCEVEIEKTCPGV
jgi:hypothetical protein